MNHDPHAGWEILPSFIIGTAWFIAFILESTKTRGGTGTIKSRWVGALQMTFLFSLGATPGLAIIADRLTQPGLDFFPLVYIVLFVAFFAPIWFWNPVKGKMFTWRGASLSFLYIIPVTLVFALGRGKSFDFSTANFIPLFILLTIVAAFLLYTWIYNKTERHGVMIASVVMGFFACWIYAICWVATWIN